MTCEKLNEKFSGQFDFEKRRRKGKGIWRKDGKEYYVEYSQTGEEFHEKRNRTFEGVRLMIGQIKKFYILFKLKLLNSILVG